MDNDGAAKNLSFYVIDYDSFLGTSLFNKLGCFFGVWNSKEF